MRPQIHEILKQYWGYDQFRPLQEDIILSVLEGNDTLALMPTGGGKSLCFQIPAMVSDGLCLVITPLIALMRDQVTQLSRRGISAMAIHSGMARREIDIALDNCAYGKIKFLYLSPERLHTEILQVRIRKISVSLLAVDEAHCISQWGYDFRPSYLQIADFRELIPDVPCIAVTATATMQVREDIQQKLAFHITSKVFVKSFARENLSYSALPEINKAARLLKMLKAIPGSAVIYVRSRKRTQSVALFLKQNGISADYYHAGLRASQRIKCQEEWTDNRIRVVVATNAFGMGIDKPDVRLVVHLDLPETLEAYYQEAGRAGRDGHIAYAALMYESVDIELLEKKVADKYPPIDTIKATYQSLANYFKIAVGSGLMETYNFNLEEFSKTFKLARTEVYRSLQTLQDQGILQLSEGFSEPSRLKLQVDRDALYQFQVTNPKYDSFLKALVRTYGGELMGGYIKIDEVKLAKQNQLSRSQTQQFLQYLAQQGIVDYLPRNDSPRITLTTPRQNAVNLTIDHQQLASLKKRDVEKMESMTAYIQQEKICRTAQLLHYFGEETDQTCGICDVCLAEKRKAKAKKEHLHWETQIIELLSEIPLLPRELQEKVKPIDQASFQMLVRRMLESEELIKLEDGRISIAI